MKNRLNTIGLGALIGSVLIAMSSLGYTMAVASQPTTIEETANEPIIVSVMDHYNFITDSFITENLITDHEAKKCEKDIHLVQKSSSRSRRS